MLRLYRYNAGVISENFSKGGSRHNVKNGYDLIEITLIFSKIES